MDRCGLGKRKSGGKSLEEGAEDASEGDSVWDGDTLDTMMETDDDSMASVSQSLEETGEGFESLGLKDLACYGLTQGEVRSRPQVMEKCGVIAGGGSGQWLWEARRLGFEPAWVASGSGHVRSVAMQMCPDALLVDGSYSKEFYATLPVQVEVVFVSGRLRSNSWIWSHSKIRWIVCSGSVSTPDGWKRQSCNTTHNLLGGITDGAVSITLVGRSDGWVEKAVDAGKELESREWASHDVLAAIDDVTMGKAVEGPEERSGKVIERKLEDEDTWLGTGLLPLEAGPAAEFVVPCTMTSTKWCRRPLSMKERWKAHDVPEEVIELIGTESMGPLNRSLQPGRCWEEGVRTLMELHDVRETDGRIKPARREPRGVATHAPIPVEVEISMKHDRFEEEESSIEASIKEKAQEMISRKRSREGHDGMLGPSVQRGKQLMPMVSVSEGSPESDTLADEEESYARASQGKAEENCGDDEPEEKRNLKATKSDDAPVPEYLWDDATRAAGKLPAGRSTSRAFKVLRRGLLRGWKVVLTKEFCNWLISRRMRWTAPSCYVKGEPKPYTHRRLGKPDVSASYQTYEWAEGGREDYRRWWKWREAKQSKSLEVGRDALARAGMTSWWEWLDGSTPFFWRWPKHYQKTIRDGLKIWMDKDKLPSYTEKQRPERDVMVRTRMRQKLMLVRNRRYIRRGRVDSLTSYFSVPKGEDDVRMVYDGTKSGLNEAMWVPRFPLPTADTHLRGLEPGTFCADSDIGEMFLNFILHEEARFLCGVDFTEMFGEELTPGQKVIWERWERCAMGLTSSPYQTVQAVLVAEEVIKGDPSDSSNVFAWDEVRMNLPGQENYDANLSWVSKVRVSDGRIACDLYLYVDDARTTGPDAEECRLAARRVTSMFNHLGIQDAARKRRWPSMDAGAWAGTVLSTSNDTVGVKVSQEKWDKTKKYVESTLDEVRGGEPLDTKDLLRRRGFLQYVTRTYPAMVPYMRGFHNTIDSWRPNRDSKTGWYTRRKGSKRRKLAVEEDGPDGSMEADVEETAVEFEEEGLGENVPTTVRAVERLEGDLMALKVLLSAEEPPLRRVRCSERRNVFYGFGDASATGFGSTLGVYDEAKLGEEVGETLKEKERVKFIHGQWTTEICEQSSNFRELINLVKTIKLHVEDGTLKGCELFMFTDNSTAEAAYWKGNSSSEGLFNSVLELRKLEMDGDLVVHLVHVSGTRMIHQGSDGLSRADKSAGVMKGERMMKHVPLHLAPDKREPRLVKWFESWWPSAQCGRLKIHSKAEDWFTTCHEDGSHLWMVPPAAGEVVAEELGRAIHKRSQNTHIILIPRLMVNRWMRKLRRETTCLFVIPVGTPGLWEKEMFEPLFMFISLPLCRYKPWTLKGSGFVEHFCGTLRSVWDGPDAGRRYLLRKFFIGQRRLDAMREDVVRELLHHPGWRPLPREEAGRR